MPVFLFVTGSRKSPSSAKLTTEATAPPCCVDVGRMIATGPSFGFRNNGRFGHDQVGLEHVCNVRAGGSIVRVDSRRSGSET